MSDPTEPELHHHAPSAGELRKILHDLVNGQHQLVAAQHTTNRHLSRLEHKMADLNASLTDLTAAVDTAVTALNTQVQPLKDQLAQAQQALADLQVQDDADKAALQASLDGAQSAADSIEAEVAKLNAADGSTPDAA